MKKKLKYLTINFAIVAVLFTIGQINVFANTHTSLDHNQLETGHSNTTELEYDIPIAEDYSPDNRVFLALIVSAILLLSIAAFVFFKVKNNKVFTNKKSKLKKQIPFWDHSN